MKSTFRTRSLVLLLCVSLLSPPQPARAQEPVPSATQAAGIFAVIAGLGAAIGIGIYLLVRQPPSITGCASDASGSMQLHNERDQRTYMLVGDLEAVKSGERLRLVGKKKKPQGTSYPQFFVERRAKDLGPCKVPVTTP